MNWLIKVSRETSRRDYSRRHYPKNTFFDLRPVYASQTGSVRDMTNIATSSGYALKLSNVSKRFGGVQALDDISFDVKVGEIHCLAGENGSGKSTLIKIVTGVYSPDPGAEIFIFDERKTSITPAHSHSQGIAVIWQDLALFPHLTVAENIGFDHMLGNLPRPLFFKEIRSKVNAVLTQLGVQIDLNTRLNALPIALRQIVAIARALMGNARLVFMDEPTSSLTHHETKVLLEIVRKLSNGGVAVVFVSHRLAEVLEISSRVTVLRDGKLVGVYPTENMTQSQLGELMTNQRIEPKIYACGRSTSETVLEVDGLSSDREFEEVSFKVGKGEIVGLTGLIGAGRTELAHVLIGMNHPTKGILKLNNRQIRLKSFRDSIKLGIAYVSEDRLSLGLIQAQSIEDNLTITVLDKILTSFKFLSFARKDQLVKKWINELAIKIGESHDAATTLSGGNQQKLVLSKWLATDPILLILDSPTVGVDVGARAGIFKIVHKLAETGMAILLISDEVAEVYYNTDRIIHMAEGRFVAEFDPRQTTVATLEEQIYA